MADNTKTCARCQRNLLLSEFVFNHGSPRWCRECTIRYQAEYRAQNREHLVALSRIRYEAKAAEMNTQRRKYREEHLEHDAERVKQWKKEHRINVRNSCCKRKAILRGALVVESLDRQKVWERDGGICHICGTPADSEDWHLDHIIPVSKGGAHVMSNVAVSHPVCNLRKHDTWGGAVVPTPLSAFGG